MNNTQFEFFYWGPCVCKFKVDDFIAEELLKKRSELTIDARPDLSGHIDNELYYDTDTIDWFMKKTEKYFNSYIKFKNEVWQLNHPSPIESVKLNSLWVNYMKKNEFNPPHIHTYDLSFVLYLQIPEKLKEESKKFISAGPGPGHIEFIYGTEDRYGDFISNHIRLPEKNDLYIFPSNLYHTVMPFRCEGERVSVSGNLTVNRKKS
jgi:hypothetical protein